MILQAVSAAQDAVPLSVLEGTLSTSDRHAVARAAEPMVDMLVAQLDTDEGSLIAAAAARKVRFSDVLSGALEAGARYAEGPLGVRFDRVNPAAVLWVETRAAELVVEMGAAAKETIRDIVSHAFVASVPPHDAARQIRAHIGLTARDSGAVLRRREELLAAGKAKAFVERATERYADKLLRRRAETIARTEIMRASNEGQQQLWNQAMDRGLLSGREQKVWIVADPCDLCAGVDGETVGMRESFSIPGPPAHPNSIPGFVRVEGDTIAATRMSYAGTVREVITSGGHVLSVTQNHEVATSRGFVRACEINEGDELFAYRERVEDVGMDASQSTSTDTRPVGQLPLDEQDGPAAIEDVFESLLMAGGEPLRAKRLGDEFHGDAAYGNGDIDVVYADRMLRDCDQAALLCERERLSFVSSDRPASRVGDAFEMDAAVALAEPPVLRRFKMIGSAVPSKTRRVGSTTHLDAALLELLEEHPSRDAGFCGELEQRLAGLVTREQVVSVRDVAYVGHVYDLQTTSGVIVAHGLIVSNCKCTVGLVS